MKEKEDARLIIIYKENEEFKVHVVPENEFASKAPVGPLSDAIVKYWRERLRIPSNASFDMYIKIPSEKSLSSLQLDQIDSIILFPIELSFGDLYAPKKDGNA